MQHYVIIRYMYSHALTLKFRNYVPTTTLISYNSLIFYLVTNSLINRRSDQKYQTNPSYGNY
jgi:hypothetical protein